MSSPLAPTMLFFLVCAFAAGWVAAKLGAHFGRRWFGGKRDPNEMRIRSLEAELRIAQSSLKRAEHQLADKDEELARSQSTVDEYAKTMNDQAAEIERLAVDLRGSVRKTNELREELTSRAEENLRATVKLHEVETELSVARVGSELMSNGALSYDAEDENDDEADGNQAGKSKVVKFTI